MLSNKEVIQLLQELGHVEPINDWRFIIHLTKNINTSFNTINNLTEVTIVDGIYRQGIYSLLVEMV